MLFCVFSPYNPPCTTLFIARLDQLSNEELYSLLVNSFQETLTGSKFMVDSKGQRIGQSMHSSRSVVFCWLRVPVADLVSFCFSVSVSLC